MHPSRAFQTAWPQIAGLALFVGMLSGCTTLSFWPERWIAVDGAVLEQASGGHYRYSKGIGANTSDCRPVQAGIYACTDGTVSKLERSAPARVRFDGRVFILGPI